MKAERIEIAWHPGLSIFASEQFLKAVGDEYGWIGGINDLGKLHCILPYTVIRRGIFRMVRFRVETIPVGDDLDVQEEKSFLNSAMEYFRSIGADIIVPATTNSIFRTYPDNAVVVPYGTFIHDLNQSEEALWENLSSKHRNIIRNAMKKGVEIRHGIEYLDIAYEMIRSTLERSKLNFLNYDAFKRLVLLLNENVEIFVAEYQGLIQGCAVIPWSKYSAYALYAGSTSNPAPGANNLLHWEAFRLFRGRGVQRYDFVGVRINPEKGSKQESLMIYKKRFGGQLVQGYMWKYSLHPFKYAAYSQAVHLLRGGDIVDQECKRVLQV